MTLPATTDVLVIGGGNAALCAAISASRLGAKVVILEAADRSMRGGNTRHTRNLRAMHDAPVGTLAGRYPENEFWQDLLRVTGGNTDEDLARIMIRQSKDLVAWLEEVGVRFQPALTGTLSLGRTNAFFLGGGKALLNAQYATAERLGVQVFYQCEVTALHVSQATFESATVNNAGNTTQISARAVVIASGGFQANDAWMREAWGEAADNFKIRGTPHNRGVVLKNLMENGATTVGDPTQCHAVAIDARAPKYDGGIATRLDCVCFSVVVNREGRRFYDEGEDFWPRRYAIWGRLIAAQPGQIAYAIVDSKVTGEFMPSMFPPARADSLESLAHAIDLDATVLRETVDAYNSAVVPAEFDPGELDNCRTEGLDPAKSHWAQTIDTPPFYAYPLSPGITFTYLGLKVDERARAAFDDVGAAKNIFAAGEVMAGNILGQGYCAGTGMTIGAVFGRIAGKEAASAALSDV